MSTTRKHTQAAVPGLPELLPEGEFVRWQGRPDWKDLAINGFHVRKLAVYFLILLLARILVQGNAGAPLSETVGSTSLLAVLAAAVLGFLALYAWLAARAARYTLTNRRLVIRCGATLPMTVNLPFDLVASADLCVRRNGCGDLPLTLHAEERASWVILWPHVKPWSLRQVKPMLRSVPEAHVVGEKLAAALRDHNRDTTVSGTKPRIVRERAPVVPTELTASAN